MDEVRKMSWDSQFLGYFVGRIDLTVVDEALLYAILKEAKFNDYRLIYLFISHPKTLSCEFLNKNNGLFVGAKVIYKYKVNKEDQKNVILNEYNGKSEALYSLAYESGSYSRFKLDENFGKDTFKRLYRKWVDNSLQSQFADKVYIFNVEEKNAGFVTLKFCEHEASIGLIAVAPSFQGRSIGSQLIDCCKKETLNRNLSILSVATQLDNNIACSFYEKNRFVRSDVINIYHFWL